MVTLGGINLLAGKTIKKTFKEDVVFVYLVSSRRGMVSLARACLESLDTIALK